MFLKATKVPWIVFCYVDVAQWLNFSATCITTDYVAEIRINTIIKQQHKQQHYSHDRIECGLALMPDQVDSIEKIIMKIEFVLSSE